MINKLKGTQERDNLSKEEIRFSDVNIKDTHTHTHLYTKIHNSKPEVCLSVCLQNKNPSPTRFIDFPVLSAVVCWDVILKRLTNSEEILIKKNRNFRNTDDNNTTTTKLVTCKNMNNENLVFFFSFVLTQCEHVFVFSVSELSLTPARTHFGL